MKQYSFLFLYLTLFFSCQVPQEPSSEANTSDGPFSWLFIGTYTKKEGHVDGKAEGIYVYKMNMQTGELSSSDTIKDNVVGKVSAFEMKQKTGKLKDMGFVAEIKTPVCLKFL